MVHTPSNYLESIEKSFQADFLKYLTTTNFLFLLNQIVHHQFQISLKMDQFIYLIDHLQYHIHLILEDLLVLMNLNHKLSKIELIILKPILLTKILIV